MQFPRFFKFLEGLKYSVWQHKTAWFIFKKRYLVKDLKPKTIKTISLPPTELCLRPAVIRSTKVEAVIILLCRVSVIVLYFWSLHCQTCVAPVVLAAILHARKCSLIQLSLSSVFRYNRKKKNNEAFQIILGRNNWTNSLWQNTKLQSFASLPSINSHSFGLSQINLSRCLRKSHLMITLIKTRALAFSSIIRHRQLPQMSIKSILKTDAVSTLWTFFLFCVEMRPYYSIN